MHYETVVVGGGIIGCSVAYHLSKAGHTDVLLVEKDQISAGTSGKAAGVIDHQFTTEARVELTKASIETFEAFESVTGFPLAFHQVGYVVTASDDHSCAYIKELIELQRRLDVDVRELDADEVESMYPGAQVDDIRLASYTPRDGYLDPEKVVEGFAAKAEENGVTVRTNTAVIGINTGNGAVTGVELETGAVTAENVIVATGAWTPTLIEAVGVEIPLRAFVLNLFVTEPVDEMKGSKPVFIDTSNSAYFRQTTPASGQVWMGIYDSDPLSYDLREYGVDGFSIEDIQLRDEVEDETVAAARERFPFMADVSVVDRWAGLPTYTPDAKPVVDEAPGVSGLYFALGGGIGVMHSPAIGEMTANLVLRGKTGILPHTEVAIDRFEESTVPDAVFTGEYGKE